MFSHSSCLRACRGEWLQSEGWLDSRYFFFFPEFGRKYYISWASQILQWWRICLPMQGMQGKQVWSLGRKDPRQQTVAATPVSLPRKFYGKRSLGAYSPWGHKELHVAEFTHMHTHTHTHSISQEQALYFIPTESPYRTKFWLHTQKVRWICVCVC